MRMFATSATDGTVNIYNLYNGQFIRAMLHPEKKPI